MFQKLDRKFSGRIVKAKDGSVVPEDEYIVFLAKDNAFAATLPQYLKNCVEMGCDAEQVRETELMIQRVNEWRQEHSDRLKNPDAKGEALLDIGDA